MQIPHVEPGARVLASEQNALIDQVNQNTTDIAILGDLPGGGGGSEAIQELIDDSLFTHEIDDTPHPAYDDLPSLTLIFENGLV